MDRMIDLHSLLPENCPNLFIFEYQRRESFKEWPFKDTDKCNVNKMAEAGFYSCGIKLEPDSVACFMCDKRLDNWEATDDPWGEHKKHAPQCAFIIMGRPEADLTVDDFLKVLNAALVNKYERSKTRKLHAKKAQDQINAYFNQKR